MAFVAGPVVLAPRLQRDALRCAAGRQATFGRRFVGARRRAEIRAGPPEQISADELEAILKDKPGPLLSVFSAKWCGPCQFLKPQLEELATMMDDKIRIVSVDSDDNAEYASMIGVRGLPSLYFIQDQQLKYKMEGADTAANLKKLVEHYFFDGPKPEEPEVPTV